MTFKEWFLEEQIHEVIETRAELLGEILNDVMVNGRSLLDAHEEITNGLIKTAFEAGRNSNE